MTSSIQGTPFPVVVCNLSAGESVNCQKGAMVWMSDNMQMQTNAGGGLGKLVSRAISGESIFQNTYTAQGREGMIAFGSSKPGNILEFDITPSSSIVAQKGSFLASETSVNFETFFQKKLGAGFFGGEGFILQKFTGNGKVFLEIDGSVVEYNLEAGQSMLIDTGFLAAMDESCSIDIEQVKGIGNAIFGGEGLFNTKVTGPGRVWLQTMPINQFAGTLIPYLPSKG
ncbi:MAG: TIGR00266 family protein [Oscillospiraceae bacterium]|nr:TIGR00266 family protein [Oscillospiraceae bacterium]